MLCVAHANGYFERPRRATGAEVANALDIASATLGQHLRAAERNLLGAVFDRSPRRLDD